MKSKRKIAVIAEFICNYGGIEKEILNFLESEKCDLYVGLYDAPKTYEKFKEYRPKVIMRKKLPAPFNSMYLRWKFRRLKLGKYDGFLIFGFHSIAAARNNRPAVWRSTQPLSYLYGWDGSQQEKMNSYLYRGNFFKKKLVNFYLFLLRRLDQKDVNYLKIILANSNNVLERLKKVYPGSKIKIVFPSVNIEKFRYLGQKNYYLSVCRLTGDKNADKIVSAFQKMPNKNLIVVGDGPQRAKLEKMAEKHKNIQIKGAVSEEELIRLYGNCIATIYASLREDFGMGPIESMASGKPAIAINDAGFKETILNGKTGMLIKSPEPKEIMLAVKKMTPSVSIKMRKACEERSKIFSNQIYASKILEAFDEK